MMDMTMIIISDDCR